ncbi:hypothetical protein DRF67_21180, partial [Chryseobacterium pennipullorum]
ILLDANNVEKSNPNHCYQKPLGYQLVHQYAIENLDIVEYDNISYQKYLKTVTSTDYMNNQPMKPTVTENSYDSNLHYQLTSKKTSHSDGNTGENTYQYAYEQNNADMITANMVSIPLHTEIKENGKIISKTKTVYAKNAQTANLILPVSAQKFYNDNAASANTLVNYNQYDTQGHLLQYTLKGSVPTAIVWGYNNTLPIAKVEGATYQEVQGLASGIIAKSNTDTDPASEKILMNALDSFRNQAAFKNYSITTYTYDPLIGVTSVTPSTGIRQFYKYDSSNRLQSVVDANNNIVKELSYNYQH